MPEAKSPTNRHLPAGLPLDFSLRASSLPGHATNPTSGREPGTLSLPTQERPCQASAADGTHRTGMTGFPQTGSGSEPKSKPERTANAKPNIMPKAATASEQTATTSSQATTTAWTICNGFQTLATKPRQQERQQRAIHGIVKPGFIPSKKIRDRSNPGWGAPPRAPLNNRRIAPPIMRASSRSFFARIPAFQGLLALAVLGPVSVACRGIQRMRLGKYSVTGTMFLLLSRNEFNA